MKNGAISWYAACYCTTYWMDKSNTQWHWYVYGTIGQKLSITKQGVMDMEKREKEGAITIKSMQEIAKAMDMQFVYGFVPNAGSLEQMIEMQALEMATKIVERTSNSMKLEDQANSKERIEKAIKERAEEIINKTPKILWD